MAPVNVGALSPVEFKHFLDSFDNVLSDCDGVLWHSKGPYPGAGALFEGLKSLGKNVYFVSNNSARTPDQYRDRFNACGIQDGLEKLIIPTDAIVDYLNFVNFDKSKKVFCVSNSVAIQGLERHGLQCKEGPLVGGEDFHQYVRYAVDDPEVGAVVFDGDFRVNLPKLYMAAAYLRRPDVHFISGPTDKILPITKDVNIMGIGQFCDMVAEFTGRQPVVLAKPGVDFAKYLLRRLALPAASAASPAATSRTLFIGDMLEQDIGLGKVAGFQTLLVLGTLTQAEMLLEKNNSPDFYTDSVERMQAQLSRVGTNKVDMLRNYFSQKSSP